MFQKYPTAMKPNSDIHLWYEVKKRFYVIQKSQKIAKKIAKILKVDTNRQNYHIENVNLI